MQKKVLVTGGTGYIGSHTAVELINSGFKVVIADNLSNSIIEVLEGIEKITGERPEFEKIDLCNPKELEAFFSEHDDIEAVIHFAAFKSVSESVEIPLKYYSNNLNSLMNLLEQMNKHHISNIVFSSSCTVYGQPDKLPVTESTPVKRAVSPYGNTKRICEEIIEDSLQASCKVKSIILRYFNPIGNHPSALIGELPHGRPDNLVPFLTQAAIGKYPEVNIYGDNYNTPDGTCIRDYLDVVDLAKAHVVAIYRLIEGKNENNYEIFNLGTGKGVSVMEMVKAFEKAANIKLKYRITGRRPGDIEQIWADPSLANQKLKWKTKIPLEETLRSAWKWIQYCNKNWIC